MQVRFGRSNMGQDKVHYGLLKFCHPYTWTFQQNFHSLRPKMSDGLKTDSDVRPAHGNLIYLHSQFPNVTLLLFIFLCQNKKYDGPVKVGCLYLTLVQDGRVLKNYWKNHFRCPLHQKGPNSFYVIILVLLPNFFVFWPFSMSDDFVAQQTILHMSQCFCRAMKCVFYRI